jgi:hypothetical protein
MKKLFLIIVFTTASILHGSELINDFSTILAGADLTINSSWANSTSVNQFTTSGGLLSILPVLGGAPTSDGAFLYADFGTPRTFNASGLDTFTITASVNSGNASSSFIVILFDNSGNGILKATFNTSLLVVDSLTTMTAAAIAYGGSGDITKATSFGISGTGSPGATDAFRMSFDSIYLSNGPLGGAVPEPGHYAAMIGVATLGAAAWRRRRVKGESAL